jgi:hypothetical protein
MKINIEINNIIQDIVADSLKIDKYCMIMNCYKMVDISKDEKWQKNFNSFYVIRRDKDWQDIYYNFFEKNKFNNDLTFENIITYLYEKTGLIEASYSSKLLATVNSNKPIWDQNVLKNLGMKQEGKTKIEQISNSIILYEEIVEWYNEFMKTGQAADCINAFNKILPKYREISDVKKIDFLLWKIRYRGK